MSENIKENTRSRIIQAAAAIVAREGVRNLTMDAVAAEAGVSKGTIFYNFASKEGLITGMVDELIAVTEAKIQETQKEDGAPGSWLRGFIASSVVDKDGPEPLRNLSFAVIAAVAVNPRSLEPMADRQERWREKITTDGIDPVLAQVIRLAADGLWVNDITGMPVLGEEERQAVIDRLIQMTFPAGNRDDNGSE